jgi:hypothetical protein
MLSHIQRVLLMLLRAVGLTPLRGAQARETELRSRLGEEEAKLRAAEAKLGEERAKLHEEQAKRHEDQVRLRGLRAELSEMQTVLASSSHPLLVPQDSNSARMVRALKAVETELRGRLARAEHALEMERMRIAPAHGDAGGDLRREELPSVDEPCDPWRDRFAATVLRSADPRALAGKMPDRLRSPPRTGFETGALPDVWRPTPRATVSFVLSTRNRAGLLRLAVQSVRDQDLSVPYETIVIDGGSTDGTIDWLAGQPDLVSIIQHDRLPHEGSRRRKGSGYSINLAFRLSQGKWICTLSQDSLLLPGSVEKALRHVEALESKGCNVGAGAFYFRDWPKMQRYLVQHTLGGMLMVNYGFFLKEALIDVGYAEEELHCSSEVYSDLSLKLWDAGYEVVDCPESFLEHLLPPSGEPDQQDDEVLVRDRHLMTERWTGRYTSPDAPEMFKQPYQRFSDFRDESDTARQFAPFVVGENRNQP